MDLVFGCVIDCQTWPYEDSSTTRRQKPEECPQVIGQEGNTVHGKLPSEAQQAIGDIYNLRRLTS